LLAVTSIYSTPKARHFGVLFVCVLVSQPLEVAAGECTTAIVLSEHRAHNLHGELVVKPRMKSSALGIGGAAVTRP
jgi:hypothetical protein